MQLQAHRRARTILDGLPYGPDCIGHVDAFGDAETMLVLSDWLALERAPEPPALTAGGLRFSPAPRSPPDMAHFWRTAGLPAAWRCCRIAPLTTPGQLRCCICPAAARVTETPRAGRIKPLKRNAPVGAGAKGRRVSAVHFLPHDGVKRSAAHRPYFTIARADRAGAGDMPKMEIARRFRDDGNAVCSPPRVSSEGVSIDGAALQVAVDKTPS